MTIAGFFRAGDRESHQLSTPTERERRRQRYRRRCHQRQRSRSGRLGDRRDDANCRPSSRGSSSPTIRAAISSPICRRPNYNVWVRGYGLVDSPKMRAKPGSNAQPHRRARAERGGRGAILSGDLLVHDDEDSAGRASSAARAHSGEAHAERLAEADEEHRLHRLPSARPGIDPHHPGSVRSLQVGRRSLDAAHPVGPVGRADDEPARRPISAACRSNISASGPTASPRAKCRRPSRRGRKASSATSSSRRGNGPRRTNICTI